MCVCVCCAHASVRASVRACERACARASVYFLGSLTVYAPVARRVGGLFADPVKRTNVNNLTASSLETGGGLNTQAVSGRHWQSLLA